jgi:hypothetical protein
VTQQLDLYAGSPRWSAVLDEVRMGVALVTLKEFAYRVDSSPSNLADALAERDRKRLAAEHLVRLVDMLPPANQLTLARAVVGPGLKVERVAPLTPEEELRATREYLAANAPGLVPGLMKALGR